MWTMEELMELKTPFLAMQDITKKDWEMKYFYIKGKLQKFLELKHYKM